MFPYLAGGMLNYANYVMKSLITLIGDTSCKIWKPVAKMFFFFVYLWNYLFVAVLNDRGFCKLCQKYGTVQLPFEKLPYVRCFWQLFFAVKWDYLWDICYVKLNINFQALSLYYLWKITVASLRVSIQVSVFVILIYFWNLVYKEFFLYFILIYINFCY